MQVSLPQNFWRENSNHDFFRFFIDFAEKWNDFPFFLTVLKVRFFGHFF